MGLQKRIRKYRFEIRHFIVLFIILATFQVVLSYLNKISSKALIEQTMDLYRKDSAIRLGNLVTTSLELLLEQSQLSKIQFDESRQNIIQAFDIILNQQTLQQNVDYICLIFTIDSTDWAIDEGNDLFNFIYYNLPPQQSHAKHYSEAISRYRVLAEDLRQTEQIFCDWDNISSFHVLVPFVPKGEFEGVVYIKITPDVSNITREISTVYDETGILFTALILFGLLAMFYITSYTVKERDMAQEQLYKEREKQVMAEVAHQKEALFTKRIYHAHHKAEKVMGFIKEEIRELTTANIQKFKYVVTRYSNFISRVIYDMKWYDPPVHATRNPMFKTDINQVIEFLVNYLFKRVYHEKRGYEFELDLDQKMPLVHINEYVVWEILEPLIQNSIDHNKKKNILITIQTRNYPDKGYSEILLMDNGRGIEPEMLRASPQGIKEIFLEHTSTRENAKNSGYGCYIAYELSTRRCGWKINAENPENGGCLIRIIIPV